MTWSYDLSTIATTPKDQVRFLIGDTISADPQLADEEINWTITQEADVYQSGASCCDRLASFYARQVDTDVGPTKLSASQRTKVYTKLAIQLRVKAFSRGGIAPVATGLSVADKQQIENNSDRITPDFFKGIDEFPGVSNPTDMPRLYDID
jgi:hypothetical protein